MTPRQRAFGRHQPPGWIPSPGETVWLRRKGIGVVRAQATVLFVVDDRYARLQITYGQYTRTEPWAIEDLRPISRERAMINRSVLTDGVHIAGFDFYNDAKDTIYWLRGLNTPLASALAEHLNQLWDQWLDATGDHLDPGE